jgi:hypothetical protein
VAPQLPPVVPPAAKPTPQTSRSGSGIWLLLAVLLGIPLLLSHLPKGFQSGRTPQQQSWVEVRRALPAVPRALLVSSQTSTVSNSGQPIRMPDGTIVNARLQGELPSSASLPPQGRFIGEEYSTGTTSWIWMTPAGASFPSWVDP